MAGRDFTTVCQLGKGSFGSVEKVLRHEDGLCYAMKKVKIMEMKDKDKKNALNEVRLLASIDHPNIINYKDAFFDQKTLCLCTVMQLAENGDLASRIKQKKKKGECFYEYEVWRIGGEILAGITALHERRIIHRDIKPANIFFGTNDVVKIGDMNVSTVLKSSLASTQIGTPFYASPEIWNNQPYSFECDIWSFGCVLYEIATLKKPFQCEDLDRLYSKVRKCDFASIPFRFSDQLTRAIYDCLALRHKRITLSELNKIFQSRTAPRIHKSVHLSSEGCQQENPEMIGTIKLPHNRKDFSKCLPKSQYETQKAQKETDCSIQEMEPEYSILSQFYKPRPGSIVSNSKKPSIDIYRSQKTLPKNICIGDEDQRPIRKSYLQHKYPSFNKILSPYSYKKISPPQGVDIELLKLRRHRLRRLYQ